VPNQLTREAVGSRIDRAREAAGLADRATLAYVSWPKGPEATVDGLFEANSNAARLLNSPPQFRDAGFNLGARDQSEIVAGERRRSLVQNYMVLELWRDGLLLFVAPADDDYLAWGRRQVPPLRVNPLALAESAFLFVRLTKEVARLLMPPPPEIAIAVSLDFRPLDRAPQMIRGDLRGRGWEFGLNPQAAHDHVAWLEAPFRPDENEGVIARAVVASVYNWFGIESDAVPFTDNEAGQIAISAARIVEAGHR
jgi:hypothetical protein